MNEIIEESDDISLSTEEKDDSNSEDEYLFEYDELDEKYEELASKVRAFVTKCY